MLSYAYHIIGKTFDSEVSKLSEMAFSGITNDWIQVYCISKLSSLIQSFHQNGKTDNLPQKQDTPTLVFKVAELF